ncbi:TPA: ATP-binding protein [archaeon]|nr:ATP-binding protein [Candidatus Undinarchaeales archaeon SRR5007147.bin71]
MEKVGSVDYFDGAKRRLYFFVERENFVEEEGFYKVVSGDKIFYIFVTSLSEHPLESDVGSRYSPAGFDFDFGERFLLYGQASVLLEYRKEGNSKIVGYKTIPRHGSGIYELDESDFDILQLPKLDFAHVRSGSRKLETKVGFEKDAYVTHWLISGWTNSGKTNSSKILLGGTLKGDGNSPFAGGIVIDPHGEYYSDLKSFNTPNDTRIVHLTMSPDSNDENEKALHIPLNILTPNDLCEVKDFASETQIPFMWACRKLHRNLNLNGPSGSEDEVSAQKEILEKAKNWVDMILNCDTQLLMRALPDYGQQSKGDAIIGAVKRRVRGIIREDSDVWLEEYYPIIEEVIEGTTRGLWYVLDVSRISDDTSKLLSSLFSYKLFNAYKKASLGDRKAWESFKPAGVLIEEAHNYLSPEESSKGNTIAKIAKEGRKFKVFTIVVEQDPSGIDQRVLKQIHNKITLQLIPKDARALTETTPYMDDLVDKIPYYEQGEGVFVSTGSFNFALPIKFPHISEWLDTNSEVCKKCKNKKTFSSDKVCVACQGKKKREDIRSMM